MRWKAGADRRRSGSHPPRFWGTQSNVTHERPRVRAGTELRQLDDEVVVYDPETDRTALLNLSAALVFELCDGTRGADEIAQRVSETFSIDRDRARADVDEILARFAEHGLLEAASHP